MQELPFHTITQFAGLGLTLIAGWFFGLASTSGGRKWRERYQDVELDSAGYRDRAEQDLREANRRIRDLEAENARLEKSAETVVVREDEGHSTATVAGAALAGAAAGAAVTHVAHEAKDEPAPVVADTAPPAPEPEHAETRHP